MFTLWCICFASQIDRLLKIAQEHRLDPRRMEPHRTPNWICPHGEVLVGLRNQKIGSGNWGYNEPPQSFDQIRTRLEKRHRDWSARKLDRVAHEKHENARKKQTPLPFQPGYYPDLENARQFLIAVCTDAPVTLILEYLDEPWSDATQLPHRHWKSPEAPWRLWIICRIMSL